MFKDKPSDKQNLDRNANRIKTAGLLQTKGMLQIQHPISNDASFPNLSQPSSAFKPKDFLYLVWYF